MTIDRIFIVFMALCGLILAGLVLLFPQSRDTGIPLYFWVLIPYLAGQPMLHIT